MTFLLRKQIIIIKQAVVITSHNGEEEKTGQKQFAIQGGTEMNGGMIIDFSGLEGGVVQQK